MDNPKLSVIVPIYNVEPYLRRCVDSVLAQTLADIEIILVNDGSTDGCADICNEYAGKDYRIKVIHKENGGLSSARNAGLDSATGEFIAFVDGDDCISPEMYMKMLTALQKEHADLCVCGYQKADENYNSVGSGSSHIYQVLPGIQAIEKMYSNDYIYFTIACNKLFKSCLFSEIRFPEGKLFEDGYAAFRYYYLCKTVVCLPDCFYLYLTRTGSITTSKLTVKNLDGLSAEVDSINFLTEKGCFELTEKAQTKYAGAIIYNLKRFDLKQKDVRLKFKEIHRDFTRLYPGIMKNSVLSKKEKILITFFRINPRFCKWVITVKKL